MKVELNADYDTAMARVTDALKAEGFGVLTEIDVKATLKKKLDIDFRRYAILGACNPPLAHQALTAVPEIGLLLPCNVTVEEISEGHTRVSLINPLTMMSFVNDPALTPIAEDAQARLERVVAALQEN
ncbi:MAG: DUF302 domain-containing protein [Anaerolineaceae bacterium]|nr:DUF302 domain-containing protein [Anaerolineaceae bacterium]